MTFGLLMVILWFQASALGLCAIISHRFGFRAGYWRGVARGMHLTQEAAMHVVSGDVALPGIDDVKPKEPN
jgi:hypothetical protein